MKANSSFDFRPLLAAVAMLAVLAATYEAAWQLPHPVVATRPPAAPASQTVPADSAAVTARNEVASRPPPPCPTRPIRFAVLSPAERRPVGLHHYVGTVSGQPATALLQWPDILGNVSGSFYLHRGGPTYQLLLKDGRRRQLVLLALNPDFGPDSRGEWRLRGRLGAVLRGTWHDTTGNHPIMLRENYAGAVRADVHTLELAGGHTYQASPQSGSACEEGGYSYQYLQFSPAQTVAPALRRAIGLSLAVVRHRLRAAYSDSHQQRRELTGFLLNDFNLLSYQVERSSTMAGDGGKGDSWTESYLFDLATGQKLTVASQLRPGYGRLLRRLIRQHLLHDPQFDYINKDHRATWVGQDTARQSPAPGALPEEASFYRSHESSIFLTGSGLTSAEFYDDDEPGPIHEVTVTIPYRELRPLVHPGTPLARMLRARGLW